MVMKTDDIVKALGCLEMKGGMHVISEELRCQIIKSLQATAKPKPVKRSPGGQKLSEDGTPAFKGKLPE